MADEYRIDSHKLIYHPERVAAWLKGKNIYPIYVEIAPSGTCNHRCIFCALDYMEYKPVFLDKRLLLENLLLMHEKGVKSVMYAGEGEPLLNKDTPEIVNKSREIGLDVSMTSNGVLFTAETSKECLGSFTWVRFSVNAGTPKTYQAVHNSRADDFKRVLTNLAAAVEHKKAAGLQTTIGVQLLLIPDNKAEVLTLGKLLKEIGVDYYSVKPYSQHPLSHSSIDPSFSYQEHLEIERSLQKLASGKFKIIFRSNAMKKLAYERKYSRCWGLPFWAYIDAKANVWACSAYLGNPEFCFGSLKEQNFVQLWEGDQRAGVKARVAEMDVTECREICRLDEINGYLEQLKFPGAHVNFI